MEQRRRELLSDESGYWRRRMDAEARMCGVAAAAQDADDEAEEKEAGGSEVGTHDKAEGQVGEGKMGTHDKAEGQVGESVM